MVTNMVQLVRIEGQLHIDPHFLVQQKQVQIVQQRSDRLLTVVIVTTTCNDDRRVDWQVTHCVPGSGAGGSAGSLDIDEVTLYHFTIHCHGLEVLKLVGAQFSICVLSTEVVNTLLDLIGLPCFEAVFCSSTFRWNYGTSATLDHRLKQGSILL